MERSRSKRNHYYDQDYDSEAAPRTKQRYNNASYGNNHRRGGSKFSRPQDSPVAAGTSYRILCLDCKVGGVIGKSGSIIKAIRQRTGAWVSVLELAAGDEERIIEITDGRRQDSDGRTSFCPAQEALLLVHERILDSDSEFVLEDDHDYRSKSGGSDTVVTRLVVSRAHVGSLLGVGGKIIEQMRAETKTRMRILPRDHNLPHCIPLTDEVLQIMGDANAVQNALAIVSSKLKESQHRDHNQLHGRSHSPEHALSPDDEFSFHSNDAAHRPLLDEGLRSSSVLTSARTTNHHYVYSDDFAPSKMDEKGHTSRVEALVFRMLFPVDMISKIVGEPNGVIGLLQNEVGVDVNVVDLLVGSTEQMIVISSEEGPDDELFPAQEALLHIQTHLLDPVQDDGNIAVTTRLVVSSRDLGCLEGVEESLSELGKNFASIRIVPREQVPAYISRTDELLQIVGEIKKSREALVEVTERLREYKYRDFIANDMHLLSISASAGNYSGDEVVGSNNTAPLSNGFCGAELHVSQQNTQTGKTPYQMARGAEPTQMQETMPSLPSALNRLPVPLVTRSTLEVLIPHQAVSKLITRSTNRLSQFSELSGAKVTLVADRSDASERIIQISGTPEQAQKAQSLLQGFVLSTQEDMI